MRKQPAFIVLAIAVVVLMAAWKVTPQKVSYEGESYRCEYEMLNGMYHGTYTSYYSNGKKRAEGSFRNNIRYGVWTVYDSTGRKRMVRDYKSNFEYELVFPKPSDEGPIPLLREPKWKPERDSTGRIPYFHLEERAVVVSKRVWRYIPADTSSPLFSGDELYHTLIDSVFRSTTGKFRGFVDSEFRIPFSEEQKMQLADTTGRRIVGYRIVEDWFFEKDRMMSETRIIGLCPVVKMPGAVADTFDLCWFYFPPLRGVLSQQKVPVNSAPEYVHTLDDLFQFRYFPSAIYRESNDRNRTLQENVNANPGTTITMEQRRVEMSIIELEHDTWIFYSK